MNSFVKNCRSLALVACMSFLITTHDTAGAQIPSSLRTAANTVTQAVAQTFVHPFQRIFAKPKPETPKKPLVATQKQSPLTAPVQQALHLEAIIANKPIIITKNEFTQLQVEHAIAMLDKTHTGIGSELLRYLTIPINDMHEIGRRQEVIRLFAQNDQLFTDIVHQLDGIHTHEEALLSYFQNDFLNQQAQKLYWHIPFRKNIKVLNTINTYLNNHRLTLGGGVQFDVAKNISSLVFAIFKVNFISELTRLATGQTNSIDIANVFFKGPWYIIKNHLPVRWDLTPEKELLYRQMGKNYEDALSGEKNQKDAAFYNATQLVNSIDQTGSLYDRIRLMAIGYLRPDGWGLQFFKKPIPGASMSAVNHLKDDHEITWWDIFSACTAQSAAQAYQDYILWTSSKQAIDQLGDLTETINLLYERMRSMSSCFNHIQQLSRVLKQHDSPYAPQLDLQTLQKDIPELQALLTQLQSSTFKGARSFFYARGRVLLAHSLCKKIKDTLIPLLKTIAEIDAYISIATVMRLSRNSDNQWTFASFAQADEPFVHFDSCWTPLALAARAQVVTNDLRFGINGHARKIIIAGPHGGGKTTILNALGLAALFAHSWGIVPASQATLTPFDHLITYHPPSGNIIEGTSRFTAEKYVMGQITSLITQNPDKRYLLLVDEPYCSTVDAVSAERTYNLGKMLADCPQIISLIATHVEQPTLLEKDTNGVCANYQVMIDELPTKNGPRQFKHSYRLEPGLCSWWFYDANRRSAFIDWLTPTPPLVTTA